MVLKLGYSYKLFHRMCLLIALELFLKIQWQSPNFFLCTSSLKIFKHIPSICVFSYLKFICVAEVKIFSFCTLIDCLSQTQGCVHRTLETTALGSVEVIY